MKLTEVKEFVKELRGLSQEELAKRENELKKVYGKRINYSKKYKAHDENNVAKEGDIVRIMETRPLSATKRFRLVEVVEEAVII